MIERACDFSRKLEVPDSKKEDGLFEDDYQPDFESDLGVKGFSATVGRQFKRPPELEIELIGEMNMPANQPLSPLRTLVSGNPDAARPRENLPLPSPISIQSLSPFAVPAGYISFPNECSLLKPDNF